MDENNEMIEYLISLSNMSRSELKNELKEYKKVINDLSRNSNRDHFLYTFYLVFFSTLNLISNNSYDSIIREIKALKYETLYEKDVLKLLRLIKSNIVKTNNYEDVDCFYLTLVAVNKLHNDRYLYSNNLFDTYSSTLRGISVQLPNPIDYDNQELIDSIEDSLDILVKKIK